MEGTSATGRPQIGKTGAVLHTIFKLWDRNRPVLRTSDLPAPVLVPAPCPKLDPPSPDQQTENMGAYPSFDLMKCEKFVHPPGPGKYGDPGDAEQWSHYVDQFQRDQHPRAAASSTAGPTSKNAAAALPSSVRPVPTEISTSTRFASCSAPTSVNHDLKWLESPEEIAGGRLHMTVDGYDHWWDQDLCNLKVAFDGFWNENSMLACHMGDPQSVMMTADGPHGHCCAQISHLHAFSSPCSMWAS